MFLVLNTDVFHFFFVHSTKHFNEKSKLNSSFSILPWQLVKYLNLSQWLAKLRRFYSNINRYIINLFYLSM